MEASKKLAIRVLVITGLFLVASCSSMPSFMANDFAKNETCAWSPEFALKNSSAPEGRSREGVVPSELLIELKGRITDKGYKYVKDPKDADFLVSVALEYMPFRSATGMTADGLSTTYPAGGVSGVNQEYFINMYDQGSGQVIYQNETMCFDTPGRAERTSWKSVSERLVQLPLKDSKASSVSSEEYLVGMK